MPYEQKLAVSAFPPVIDPVVAVLEVQSGQTVSESGWTQWPRIDIAEVSKYIVLPPGVCHWFGPSADMDKCPMMLGYDVGGKLKYFSAYDAVDGWLLHEAPAEMTGRAELRPSMRLIFDNERSLQAFHRYLHQVVTGKMPNPTLEMLLKHLPVQPTMGIAGVMKEAPIG